MHGLCPCHPGALHISQPAAPVDERCARTACMKPEKAVQAGRPRTEQHEAQQLVVAVQAEHTRAFGSRPADQQAAGGACTAAVLTRESALMSSQPQMLKASAAHAWATILSRVRAVVVHCQPALLATCCAPAHTTVHLTRAQHVQLQLGHPLGQHALARPLVRHCKLAGAQLAAPATRQVDGGWVREGRGRR